MVERFDSYVYRVRRTLPAPAQVQLDAISQLLPSLKQTLARLDTFDPQAQDARRLMSIHLPGLIDRYQQVPAAYRQESDGEGNRYNRLEVVARSNLPPLHCPVSFRRLWRRLHLPDAGAY